MQSLVNLYNPDGTKAFKLFTIHEQHTFDITIFQEADSYTCKVTTEDIKKFAKAFEVKEDAYVDSLKSLICTQLDSTNVDVSNYEFAVYKNKKIKYFYTKVDKTDYASSILKVLNLISKDNSALKQQKISIEKDIESINAEKELYTTKSNQYKSKFITESILINSFLPLLNEKKRQIKTLTNEIEGDIDSEEFLTVSKKSKTDEPVETKIDSDIDDYNTDDERNEKITHETPKLNIPVASTVASTSKVDDDDLFDLLDDDSPPILNIPARNYVKEHVEMPSIKYIEEAKAIVEDKKIVADKLDEIIDKDFSEPKEVIPVNAVMSTQDMIDNL